MVNIKYFKKIDDDVSYRYIKNLNGSITFERMKVKKYDNSKRLEAEYEPVITLEETSLENIIRSHIDPVKK